MLPLLRHRTRLVGIVVGVFGTAAFACATVADLDVTREPGGHPAAEDLDEASARDGSLEGSASDGGVDAKNDSLTPPSACSCSTEQACCLPSGGGVGKCTAAAAGSTCGSAGGLFVRCAGADVPNGRVCCFTASGMATEYAASCVDAGAQVCANTTECGSDTCQPIMCRSIMIGVCAPAGGPLPTCPP